MFKKLFGAADDNNHNAAARTVEVGWLLQDESAGVIWDTPTPVKFEHDKPTTGKSVQLCPAAIQFDRLHYRINCPVDLRLRVAQNNGQLQLQNVDGNMSSVRPAGLQKLLVMSPQNEWRHPSRPLLQLMTPYVFLSDEPVYVNQFPPFLHYSKERLPGVQICGRFPIDVWPRAHMWAIEWHDTNRDLVLKRGDPLFYVRFETRNPASPVRLVEAKMTEELESYIRQISDVTNYVNQSFQLFKTARSAGRRNCWSEKTSVFVHVESVRSLQYTAARFADWRKIGV